MNTLRRLITLANVQHQVHTKKYNSEYGVEVCMRNIDCKDVSIYWDMHLDIYFKHKQNNGEKK